MIPDQPRRYELKLVCDARYLDQARSWMRLHPAGLRVAYPPRRVNSLYFDTPGLGGLETNLQGVGVRNKLRLRWYGDALPEVLAVLELKHKDNLLGTKLHFPLPRTLDLSRPWIEILATLHDILPIQGQTLLKQINAPVLLNHYQREYYVTPDDAVRVTLDYDQRAYDQRLTPRPNLDAPLLLEDVVIIEVKADGAQEEQVREVIRHFPLPRSRNSKYVNGVLAAW
ncbi:MAG: polyphosphate polymerase domain-containing protein [Anaerolineae bacterium]|nr:polyphosphate polymerase domain-containing protein [Anaerolineae bacterium]HPD41367.1 polyphosphate polymerase domain-containing protein [Anaerolineae bacterium]HXK42850.1 polyphosphate polymerase domain-containing protein [Anaerolineae bacterium]